MNIDDTTDTNKCCGTCRYFGEENEGEPAFCEFTVWKRYVFDEPKDVVEADGGADCKAWERKQ